MTEVSFLAAFAGGVLSLLSPCSALLLPSFFAYAFTSPTRLLARTLVFLAGMCTLLIPLGLGASIVAELLLDYRETTILVAGSMLIAFGVLELTGLAPVPAVVAARLPRARAGTGVAAVFGTGLAFGMSGFCSGPLLGAILTIAASSVNPAIAGALLFTYALGAVAPLFVLAWLWDRYQLGQRRWVRGRTVRVGPLAIHSTNLIAGILLIALGVSFIVFQGGVPFSFLYDDLGLPELSFRAEDWIASRFEGVGDGLWLLLIGGLALVAILARRRFARRTERRAAAPTP